MSKTFKFFQDQSKKLIFTSKKSNVSSLKLSNTEIKTIQTNGSNTDLNDLVSCLTKMNYKDVLIEAGPNLLTSFINANLIDEFIIYISPKILSNTANYFFNGKGFLASNGILMGYWGYSNSTYREQNKPDLSIHAMASIGFHDFYRYF